MIAAAAIGGGVVAVAACVAFLLMDRRVWRHRAHRWQASFEQSQRDSANWQALAERWQAQARKWRGAAEQLAAEQGGTLETTADGGVIQ